jgi:hypothetical protein
MQWGVQYQLNSGTIGLCIFSADDFIEANVYILEMLLVYGYQQVFNLQPLSDRYEIEELIKKFPKSSEPGMECLQESASAGSPSPKAWV